MSEPTAPGTIFESFNARSLPPEQVASTFVPSDQYDRLVRHRHSVVVGPRGSGKTTLLKMLQQRALEAWRHPRSEEYRARIDYAGVFVPTDITWSVQLKALGAGRLDQRSVYTLGYAAFTTQVQRSLLRAFGHRVASELPDGWTAHLRVTATPAKQAELVTSLAEGWRLSPKILTFDALNLALSRRLMIVAEEARRLAGLSEQRRIERLAEQDFVASNCIASVSYGIDAFEAAVGVSGKWALLFDELELAQPWVREELLASLRSVDDRLVFKLAMSPYNQDIGPVDDVTSASPDNDYDQIVLWYVEKEQGYKFAEAIWRALTERATGRAIPPHDALEYGYFESEPADWADGTAYAAGSRHAKNFAKLWEADPTFRAFLGGLGIDGRLIHEASRDERAAILRKIAPLVVTRNEFRTRDSETPSRRRKQSRVSRTIRTRKNPLIYTGAESLFAVTEGNPRWLIGIIDQLLQVSHFKGEVDRPHQARAIARASQRFAALLRNAPLQQSTDRGVLSILADVGKFIFAQVVREPFTADPVGSFIVDSHVSPDVEHALGIALNTGAIVYVPDEDQNVLIKSLRGKRFRLSYLLAANYWNPIRLGRALSLSTILTRSTEAQHLLPEVGL
jgi:hypothetical protein